MSVLSVTEITSHIIDQEKDINPHTLTPITDIKLVSIQSETPSIPGYDLVTCIDDLKKPFVLEEKYWIAVGRDCRKSPILKFSLLVSKEISLQSSTVEYFRLGKPIYEIYGGRWNRGGFKQGGIYHCKSWDEALQCGKVALTMISQELCLVACLDPIYRLNDENFEITIENRIVNPSLTVSSIPPDIQTFIFPEGPTVRLYLPGGISFSGNVLTDSEGTRYHASHIYYYREDARRRFVQCAITVISNFESPCHDYFHSVLLQILSGPPNVDILISQMFLTRLVPSGLAGVPREPYSNYHLIFQYLSVSTLMDLFRALLLEERIIIVADRHDIL